MNADADLDAGLRSDDPEERRRTTARLEEATRGLDVNLLLKALGDADWRVRSSLPFLHKSSPRIFTSAV